MWTDSVSSSQLPRAVRLDLARDSLLPPTYNRFHLLQPVAEKDSLAWSGIMNAWWMAPSIDSLVLMLNGVDAGWTARLRKVGDSLSGTAAFAAPGEQGVPFTVLGRRVKC